MKAYTVPVPTTITPHRDFEICGSCKGEGSVGSMSKGETRGKKTCYRCNGDGFVFTREAAAELFKLLEADE